MKQIRDTNVQFTIRLLPSYALRAGAQNMAHARRGAKSFHQLRIWLQSSPGAAGPWDEVVASPDLGLVIGYGRACIWSAASPFQDKYSVTWYNF